MVFTIIKKIITWVFSDAKNMFITVLSIILICSILVNVFFLGGKGITIDRRSQAFSNSNSSSTSCAINTWYTNGRVKLVRKEFDSEKERWIFMEGLDPIQFLFKDLEKTGLVFHKYIVYYPMFDKE